MFFVLGILFFFQAEDGIRDGHVTGVQTCALPILSIPFIRITEQCSSMKVFEIRELFLICHFKRGLKIGRASCRERVWISVGAVSLKKKKDKKKENDSC